ncbi:thioesterase II family protein [Longimicrobium terrae]|uniref:Medium-chain acyl-[acyl-carrier-protein] hydrolase n=1 Tax=Longimicrobium terrae TaxID=1639882 RepID=A0A841H2J6_9BACT|nr:thioesterase [Longimicrobium terrae]MBB4637945.1 medium-chain acyl-[acyl-carrier-protein] hydrolase [Longimicrobium terrae]MBB6072192.1 medium-chain acyl-[acyl-carrier-protein] hydrolase [Longimicrobium terrae]NNC28382.1 thioesterase [Longimicrobium terrae]
MNTVDRWIARPRPNPRARLRLFCLAHAGGGASAFRGWADALPAEVEVCPVQLPGRENRIGEPAITRMEPLIDALLPAVAPYLDLPFALFGHSNGALIAFELARRLRAEGRPGPVHLFASGRRAPDRSSGREPTSHLPDAEFLADLHRLGGLPDALLQHQELISLLLPTLRADVALNECYVFGEQEPLDCPITAYIGLADSKATNDQVQAWGRHTRAPFVIRGFPGGHFFLQEGRADFLRVLAADLLTVARGLPAG